MDSDNEVLFTYQTLVARKRRKDQVDNQLQRCLRQQPTEVLRGEPELFPGRESGQQEQTRGGLGKLLVSSRLSGLQEPLGLLELFISGHSSRSL